MKRIVTKAEFQNYIKRQRNDRPLNFLGATINSACGCPMIHFGKSKGIKVKSCGWQSWLDGNSDRIAEFENNLHIMDIIKNGTNNSSKTYGELKKNLIA